MRQRVPRSQAVSAWGCRELSVAAAPAASVGCPRDGALRRPATLQASPRWQCFYVMYGLCDLVGVRDIWAV